MDNSFYSRKELVKLGFKTLGENVFISRYARFYDIENIELGNNLRIDDFCIITGKIKLGNHIHISAYTALYGKLGIEMEDYSGISPRCSIFSATDDFSGNYMIGPMTNQKFTNVMGGKVNLGKYSQLGSNCVVFPDISIMEGAVVGAMSLVNSSVPSWTIYAGIPAKKIKDRSKIMLKYLESSLEIPR